MFQLLPVWPLQGSMPQAQYPLGNKVYVETRGVGKAHQVSMCEDDSHPGPQGACSTTCRDNLQNIAVCVDEAQRYNVGNGHDSGEFVKRGIRNSGIAE